MPKVITANKTRPNIQCEGFKEGDEGFILTDGKGRHIAWVRYKHVSRILPDEESRVEFENK